MTHHLPTPEELAELAPLDRVRHAAELREQCRDLVGEYAAVYAAALREEVAGRGRGGQASVAADLGITTQAVGKALRSSRRNDKETENTVKVRIAITLDVDPDAWTKEFGTAPADVRADVKYHVEMNTLAHFGERGLLAK